MAENKIKQTSVRYFENDLEKISELASKMDVSTAEIVREWRKAYERLKLEETSSHGQNLTALRGYLTNIEQLFQTIVNTSEQNVKGEQDRALESERKLQEQSEKAKLTIKLLDDSNKELQKEVDRLTKELKRYEGFEESVESRIQDKDQLLATKNEHILSLTEEIKELKEKNKTVDELRENTVRLHSQISELNEQIKNNEFQFNMELQQKDMDRQHALISLREELQDKYETRISQIYDAENEKRDKARESVEARLREAHAKELADLREAHAKELADIRAAHQAEIERLQNKSE